jgi:methylated-DNA-[protein]-cysteine S-methyltransferase
LDSSGEDYENRMARLLRIHYGSVEYADARNKTSARTALQAYFAGDLSSIDSLGVETGGTSFQREVWAALRSIPAGRTTSYGELASRIGRSRAIRAVGCANGSNPVGVVVPCHRVIGADRSLTGYGGGLTRKQWLLRHEGVEI